MRHLQHMTNWPKKVCSSPTGCNGTLRYTTTFHFRELKRNLWWKCTKCIIILDILHVIKIYIFDIIFIFPRCEHSGYWPIHHQAPGCLHYCGKCSCHRRKGDHCGGPLQRGWAVFFFFVKYHLRLNGKTSPPLCCERYFMLVPLLSL